MTGAISNRSSDAKRKEVWEAMRAVERADDLAGSTGGATCATGRNADGTFGEGQEGFAASTEKVTGKDKSTINRAIRRVTVPRFQIREPHDPR